MNEPVLTLELKQLLEYIKQHIVQEFPINIITLNYALLAILDNNTCEAYKLISKVMLHNSIVEFKNSVIEFVLGDCNADVKNTDVPKFSDDFDIIAKEISDGGTIVDSAMLFSKIVKKSQRVKDTLKNVGVSVEQIDDVILANTTTKKQHEEHKHFHHIIKKNIKQKTSDATHRNEDKSNNSTMSNIPTEIVRIIPEESNIVESSCKNLVRIASTGAFKPIVGLDETVDEIFDILGKCDRNTVAIVGGNGIGKTSLVYRLAQRIYELNCPPAFRDKYVMQFGDAINNVLIEEMNRAGKYIAFMDDAEKLFLNKETELNNMYVLAELLKCPNVSSIICMNETTFSKTIEAKPEISRHLHKVTLGEPTGDDLVSIVRSASRRYEEFHNVRFDDECITLSINLSKKFILKEQCPKSALNVLDAAASHLRTNVKDSNTLKELKEKIKTISAQKNSIQNSGNAEDFDLKDRLTRDEISFAKEIARLETEEYGKEIRVSAKDVKYAISKITGIPLTELDDDEKQRLKELYINLTNVVIGQDEAVSDICKAVKRQRIGLSNPNKPCVMLFCGKTGVGKSFLAKRLAYEVFGDENNMVRLDMSEYSDKTAVTKLYGASAGYIGYEEGGVLTEAIKKKPRCVLLLDEIEKAHDDVYNVFLQVFDEGRLSDNKGTLVDFKNVIIIMTSNVGAQSISDKTARIGFGRTDESLENKEIVVKAIKKHFKPEFINRIDNICHFNQLTDDNLRSIIRNEVKKVRNKVVELGYDLDDEIINGKLIDNIFEKIKEESEYGARPILREIQKQLEDKLADYIIENTVPKGFVFHYTDIY